MPLRDPFVGVFDAGIGGIPLAALLKQAGLRVLYLGDSGRRPYGPKPNQVVSEYVAQAEQFFAAAGCDAWVIACNTASVVADDATAGLLPRVDMVSAVVAGLPETGREPLGLLATAGTVASGAFPRALPQHDVHQIATEELLRLAEEGGGDDHARVRKLAEQAFTELRGAGCRLVVLACTDFTCVLPDLRAVAGDLVLFDPLVSAARLVQQPLWKPSDRERDVLDSEGGDRLVLTGPHPVDVQDYALRRFGIELPAPEYLALDSR